MADLFMLAASGETIDDFTRENTLIDSTGFSTSGEGEFQGLAYESTAAAGQETVFMTAEASSADNTRIAGFRFRAKRSSSGLQPMPASSRQVLFSFVDGSASIVRISLELQLVEDRDMFRMHVQRPDGLLVSTENFFPFDEWLYIELKIVFDSSAGEVELRVNSLTEAQVSNVDTLFSADPADVDRMVFRLQPEGEGTQSVTDIYLLDAVRGSASFTAGSNTKFLSTTPSGIIVRSDRPSGPGPVVEWEPSSLPSPQPVSLFLFIGQSNTAGTAPLVTGTFPPPFNLAQGADPRFHGPQPGRRVWNPLAAPSAFETLDPTVFNNQSRFAARPSALGATMDFGTAFMEKAYQHQGSSRDVLCAQIAAGGTWMFPFEAGQSLSSNSFGSRTGAIGVGRYNTLLFDIAAAYSAAVVEYGACKIEGIFVIQGESEGFDPFAFIPEASDIVGTDSTYIASRWDEWFRLFYFGIQELIAQVTADPDPVPFIVGRIGDITPLSAMPNRDIVRRRQEDLLRQDDLNVQIVDLDGLQDIGDNVHYDGPSQEIIGNRMFEAYLRTIDPAPRLIDFDLDSTVVTADTSGQRLLLKNGGMVNGRYACHAVQAIFDARKTNAALDNSELQLLVDTSAYLRAIYGSDEEVAARITGTFNIETDTYRRFRQSLIALPGDAPRLIDPHFLSALHLGLLGTTIDGSDATAPLPNEFPAEP